MNGLTLYTGGNTRAILIPEGAGKERRSRLGQFAGWLTETGRTWHRPDLAAYANHLLTTPKRNSTEPRTPQTVVSYLGTIRGRYKSLLKERAVRAELHAVLLAFIGPPELGEEARHLDGNPSNNCLANLEWGTHQQNADDRWRHGTMPIPHESIFTKLTPGDIPRIRELGRQGLSSRKVGEMFGTSHTTIQKIWRGERWKGY